MEFRVNKIHTCLKVHGIDGLFLSCASNISYLTDYCSRDSYLLITKKENIFFTDFRYLEEVEKRLGGRLCVQRLKGDIFEAVKECVLRLNIRALGFEASYLAFSSYQKLKETLPRAITLKPTCGIVEKLRRVKDASELRKIRRATRIAQAAILFAQEKIRPGKREIEVVAELEHFIRYNGARSSAFEIIVAAGPNSCFPHHLSSLRKLRKGEPVLVDLGVNYEGYKSDLTRVFFLGKINSLAKKIYQIVRQAQTTAICRIRTGIMAKEVDAQARNFISEKGFGEYFGHSLGHGIGLDVHEAPRLSAKEDSVLRAGEVFTVEPAIYLPGKFGIRIEDMVLVTKKGVEVLSGSLNK